LTVIYVKIDAVLRVYLPRRQAAVIYTYCWILHRSEFVTTIV